MSEEIKLNKISEVEWEIPKTGKMNVPVRIFASEKLLKDMKEDKTLEQARNVAMLPGIVKKMVLCADSHQGYGMPIGGVAAFNIDNGIISPGMTGYDINCGIRILTTNLSKKDVEPKKKQLIEQIFRDIPSGVGKGGVRKINKEEIKEILETGALWAVKNGYGTKDDLESTEDKGCISGAKAEDVSQRAISRGLPQLGSLGSGNHFLEIQEVDEIFDREIAAKFGIHEKGQITIGIHCGSRGLGHQVASDYIKEMEEKYGYSHLPDRELINAPVNSELGKKYFSAMACAANFAFCNRQMITQWVRNIFKKFYPNSELNLLYDVCHNIVKFEDFEIGGQKIKLCVHRKGATRSFGPGRKEIPLKYRDVGQPILIPGSMGTASYVLVGTKKAEEISFASTCHGAGRVESRSRALRELRGEEIKKQLNKKGIEVISGSWKGLAEEAPQVYKDIDEVVSVSHKAGIGNLVAKVKPVAVMKG